MNFEDFPEAKPVFDEPAVKAVFAETGLQLAPGTTVEELRESLEDIARQHYWNELIPPDPDRKSDFISFDAVADASVTPSRLRNRLTAIEQSSKRVFSGTSRRQLVEKIEELLERLGRNKIGFLLKHSGTELCGHGGSERTAVWLSLIRAIMATESPPKGWRPDADDRPWPSQRLENAIQALVRFILSPDKGRKDADVHVVDEELLGKRLNEWLWTYDLVDLSQFPDSEEKERQAAWREFAEREPSHAELTQTLRKFIELSKQLSQLLESSRLPPGINAGPRYLAADLKARHKTSPRIKRTIKAGKFVEDLRDRLELLREVCTRLESFHASRTPSHRPTKDKLSNLLYELAVIFIDVTGQDGAVQDLSRARDSIFITWASVVLKPFFPRAETSRSALAARSNRFFSE